MFRKLVSFHFFEKQSKVSPKGPSFRYSSQTMNTSVNNFNYESNEAGSFTPIKTEEVDEEQETYEEEDEEQDEDQYEEEDDEEQREERRSNESMDDASEASGSPAILAPNKKASC